MQQVSFSDIDAGCLMVHVCEMYVKMIVGRHVVKVDANTARLYAVLLLNGCLQYIVVVTTRFKLIVYITYQIKQLSHSEVQSGTLWHTCIVFFTSITAC